MKHRRKSTLLNTVSAVTYDMSMALLTALQRMIVWLQNPIPSAHVRGTVLDVEKDLDS